jgi:imidazolonepropionase-like amidohydrolase
VPVSPASRAIAALLLTATFAAAQITTTPKQGLRENDPRTHALTNARVVSAPGKTIEKGTVLIRDGLIVDVGPAVKIPPEARVWDLAGKTIYPGFIDSYSRVGLPETLQPEPLRRPEADPDNPDAKPKEPPREQIKGTHSWNPKVTPERSAAEFVSSDKKGAEKLRSLGFSSALVVPARGIFRGSSALVNLHDADTNTSIVAPHVAQHVAFDHARQFGQGYPSSLMGAIALIRQTFLDADWYQRAQDAYRKAPAATERPEANASLQALAEHAQRKQPAVFEAEDELDLLRALRIADEFKLRPILFGNGFEYRVRKALNKAPVIVPLDFPKPPEVERPETAIEYSLDELQHWDRAPSNPALLVAAGTPIAFTTAKLEKPEQEFWSRVRLAVRRGLSKEAALAALTSAPAEMFGLADRLGTIAPGRIANLVVASGDLFGADDARVQTTWVDGRWYDTERSDDRDPRGAWELTAEGRTLPLVIEGELDKLETKVGEEKGSFAIKDTAVLLVAPAKLFEKGEGGIRFSGRLAQETIIGTADGPNESKFAWTAKRTAPYTAKKEDKPSPLDRALEMPETFPAGAFGRTAPPEQPAAVLIQGATVWTAGPQGTLQNADLLVTGGKITSVGTGLRAPAGAAVVEGKGLHVTPGIIDCHSHIAISRGVNEGSHAVTAEVRVGDVLDPIDIDIYRQLGGGVTTANLLHGSANPIGGQNQVIKLRWGGLAEDLKFADAMPGVKFALGENVKQSNRDRPSSRYPQTRMGVEEIMRDRFRAALEYDAASKRKDPLPFRRDLQLEALAEIVTNKRLIHCHAYRLDEILAFLNVANEFKIRPGTLQHILEGYKVAGEIAKAGVGASSFADWWAYKVEAWDAIPDNAAMMHSQGVLTSINSDSPDLARRLNTEAAKSIKWGGLSPEEALKLVTIYPAKQLRIDAKTGSLEAGKDADFAIWSAHPLSNYAHVKQTWIEGRKYFDRAEDAEARKGFAAQREALVQKALAERVKEIGKPREDEKKKDREEKTPSEKEGEEPTRDAYNDGRDQYSCRHD